MLKDELEEGDQGQNTRNLQRNYKNLKELSYYGEARTAATN